MEGQIPLGVLYHGAVQKQVCRDQGLFSMSPMKTSNANAISKLLLAIWLQSTILNHFLIFVTQAKAEPQCILLFTDFPALLKELKYKLVPSSPMKHQSDVWFFVSVGSDYNRVKIIFHLWHCHYNRLTYIYSQVGVFLWWLRAFKPEDNKMLSVKYI